MTALVTITVDHVSEMKEKPDFSLVILNERGEEVQRTYHGATTPGRQFTLHGDKILIIKLTDKGIPTTFAWTGEDERESLLGSDARVERDPTFLGIDPGKPGGDKTVEAELELDPDGNWRIKAMRESAPVGQNLEALRAIAQYGSDTLSGRADGGPDDRDWQREAVKEMTRRARVALAGEIDAPKMDRPNPIVKHAFIIDGTRPYCMCGQPRAADVHWTGDESGTAVVPSEGQKP